MPSLSVFEVFKRIAQQPSEGDALQSVAAMQQGTVVELSVPLALDAARPSLDEKLPTVDGIILATARAHKATLWTQDADLENHDGVRFVAGRG